MIVAEKPGTPAEVLEHHGVKGQKWGVRKHTTSAQRTVSIRRARAQSFKESEEFRTAPRGSAARKRAKKVWLNNPDRATQLRMTRGEKVVLGILGLAIPPAGVGIAVGATARVATRKHIERKQARGGYR